MPYWWGLIRQKGLPMAATARVIWLCACQTVGWCLCVTCFNSLKGVTFVVVCVKCVATPITKKKQDDPPLRGSWKLNDPPLNTGSKPDDPAPFCFGPHPSAILFDHSLKEKHKYRPQNFKFRFHLQGCSYVLKCPPTLPTNKDTHCNDKRFGNLPPSFRSLAFFLGLITMKSLAL